MRFTKKLLAATIVLTMVFAMVPTMVMAQEANAAPSAHTVMVDGETVAFRVFLIDGNNFFMLRDIAYALSGSPSQFEVTWDADLGAINLLRGTAYTVVGGEMESAAEAPEAALESTAVVYVDGIGVDLRAYNIGGNNFFMLRYLGDAVGFEVDWDPDEAVVLITSVAAEVPPVQELEEPAEEDEPADPVDEDEPADDDTEETELESENDVEGLNLSSEFLLSNDRSSVFNHVFDDLELTAEQVRSLAEAGDANAQLVLGIMYSLGWEAPADFALARQWLLPLAEDGNAAAQSTLGHLYLFAEGADQSRDDAYYWLTLAAEQGHLIAQVRLMMEF